MSAFEDEWESSCSEPEDEEALLEHLKQMWKKACRTDEGREEAEKALSCAYWLLALPPPSVDDEYPFLSLFDDLDGPDDDDDDDDDANKHMTQRIRFVSAIRDIAKDDEPATPSKRAKTQGV